MDVQLARAETVEGALEEVRALLAALDLPHEDLTPAHLEHFFVARGEGAVVGVVGMEPCGAAALLRSLAVRPSRRGRGIGARLTEQAERHARRQGAREVYLLTTTAADYFRRRGYEPVDRDALPPAIRSTEEAARLCPAGAACLRKKIER